LLPDRWIPDMFDKKNNPSVIKDPDEFIRKRGVDALVSLLADARNVGKWYGTHLIGKHSATLKTDLGREQLISEAFKFISDFTSLSAIDRENLLKIIGEATGLSEKSLKDEEKKVRLKARETKSLDELQKLMQQAGNNCNKGTTVQEKIKDIESGLTKLKHRYTMGFDSPGQSLSQYLNQKYERDSQVPTGSLIGYKLDSFSEFSKKMDGVQVGLYIAAAHTGIGKTLFLTNIAWDLIKSNKDIKVLYFSLDDNKDTIIYRLVSIEAKMPINDIQKMQNSEKKVKIVKAAYDKLIKYAEQNRLEIIDIGSLGSSGAIEDIIRRNTGQKMVVLIDGLYNMNTSDSFSIREKNVERANILKAISDSYKIPVICTGELRKKSQGEIGGEEPTIDDIMESGKFLYNANLIWLLSRDKKNEKILHVKFGKSKLASFERMQTFKIITDSNQMEEYK